MGKVKVEIRKGRHGSWERSFWWSFEIDGFMHMGLLRNSEKEAKQCFENFARRLRIPDDAWEFVEADNG